MTAKTRLPSSPPPLRPGWIEKTSPRGSRYRVCTIPLMLLPRLLEQERLESKIYYNHATEGEVLGVRRSPLSFFALLFFTSRKRYKFMKSTKRPYFDFLPLPLLAFSAWEFSRLWDPESAKIVVFSLDDRPFVYRVLLPALARGLVSLGFSPSASIGLLLTAFSLGLFFVMKSLLDRPGAALLSFAFCEGLLMLLTSNIKVYDLPTVFFFALSLLLLERGRIDLFLLLFPIITLNRETSFLLSLFFAVRFFGRIPALRFIWSLAYQAGIYIGIRLFLLGLYGSRNGSELDFRPLEVAREYISSPLSLLIVLGLLGLILWLVVRGWETKPLSLRLAFLVFSPILLFLHLIAGHAFELRVFAELAPVVFLLMASPGLPAITGKDTKGSEGVREPLRLP